MSGAPRAPDLYGGGVPSEFDALEQQKHNSIKHSQREKEKKLQTHMTYWGTLKLQVSWYRFVGGLELLIDVAAL
jgi:hypothetical protein